MVSGIIVSDLHDRSSGTTSGIFVVVLTVNG